MRNLRETLKRDLHGLLIVATTIWIWLYFGGKVRRAYRKALKNNRTYQLDNLPSGEPRP
jgi:hypothetical protein|tara:strand:+ start:1207 stop:1383 length:177 start_codon:yes stop_codon:yes gene_type:complete